MENAVLIIYSKKTGKFQYASIAIGGVHHVKGNIASQIIEKLPKRLSTKKTYFIDFRRAGRTYHYEVSVTA